MFGTGLERRKRHHDQSGQTGLAVPPRMCRSRATLHASAPQLNRASASAGYQGLQGFLLRFVSEARASLRPKTSARGTNIDVRRAGKEAAGWARPRAWLSGVLLVSLYEDGLRL